MAKKNKPEHAMQPEQPAQKPLASGVSTAARQAVMKELNRFYNAQPAKVRALLATLAATDAKGQAWGAVTDMRAALRECEELLAYGESETVRVIRDWLAATVAAYDGMIDRLAGVTKGMREAAIREASKPVVRGG